MLLAQYNEVITVNIVQEKIDLLNNKQSLIADVEIEDFLSNKDLNFVAALSKEAPYKNADYVIVATPTDYDTGNSYWYWSFLNSNK
jgi:UDPglucose 6-dehydrogenase